MREREKEGELPAKKKFAWKFGHEKNEKRNNNKLEPVQIFTRICYESMLFIAPSEQNKTEWIE